MIASNPLAGHDGASSTILVISNPELDHLNVRRRRMSSDEVLSNQRTIIANQEKIQSNQLKLDRMLANQERIIANQESILSNQEKLDSVVENQKRILANQEEILSRLGK